MKKILLVILMLCVYQKSYSRTLIFEDFNDESRISFKSNIKITNSSAIVSNTGATVKGYFFSIKLTKLTNEEWRTLNLDYIKNNGNIKLNIFDQNTNAINHSPNLTPITFDSTSPTFVDLNSIVDLKNKNTIVLKYTLNRSAGVTPIFNAYDISVNLIKSESFTPKNSGLTGAPSPFKVDNNSYIRFYYKFEKDCSASLKIYDTNYNLIKVVFENQIFRSGSDLDGTWDGKNGNNVKVLSGVYIAILEIDGSTSGVDPFIFALIR